MDCNQTGTDRILIIPDGVKIKDLDECTRLAISTLLISLRDLCNESKTLHARYCRVFAYKWFTSIKDKTPFSYRNVCSHLGIDHEVVWLRVRRNMKVRKKLFIISLKSAEYGICGAKDMLNEEF